jgi:hypothetical protein
VEPYRVFFNVSFDRNEILINEFGGSLIVVRLGFQPSAGRSSRCGTEVEQNRHLLFFCRGE